MKKSLLKKGMVFVLVVALVFGVCSVGFAADTPETSALPEDAASTEAHDADILPSEDAIQSIALEPEYEGVEMDEIDMDSTEEIPVEYSLQPASMAETEEVSVELQEAVKNISIDDLISVEEMGASKGRAATRAASAEYEGAIDTQGKIDQYGFFTLAPGQILQAGLECPNSSNMDYDLVLIEYDAATGGGTIVKSSTYSTYVSSGMSRTLDEGLDYINTSSTNKQFIVGVHAFQGASAMIPYKLYLSLDAKGAYNEGEADQNASNPCASITYNNSITGLAMNSPSDVDWFKVSWGAYPAYENLQMTLSAGSNSIELYKDLGNSKYQKIAPKSGNTYVFNSSTSHEYLIRVFTANRASHAWNTYTMGVSLTSAPTKAWNVALNTNTFASDPNKANEWATFGTEFQYFSVVDWFTVGGKVTDAFNKPVTSGKQVDLTFINSYWATHGNDTLAYVYDTAWTDAAGNFVTTMTLQPARGEYRYTSQYNYTTEFDLAMIKATVDRQNGEIGLANQYIWHKAYSYYN